MVLKKAFNFIKNLDYALVLVLLAGGYLRLANLGYSDYQGDEIRAQYIPIQGENFTNFLLRQRKGPFQFVISYMISFFDPDFSNYWLDRLPFALAAVASLYFFYKFALLIFNRRIAFFSSLFILTNGFFVALSRILQYQGFVFLFCSLALYYFALLAKNPAKKRYLYLGTFTWGLSMLTHYDGLFIAPFMAYLLFKWWRQESAGPVKSKIIHILGSAVLPSALILTFYGALILSLSLETKQYWSGRLTGTTSAKNAGTSYLFRVYQPYLALQTYLGLFALGLSVAIATFISFVKNTFRRPVTSRILVFFSESVNPEAFLALFAWLAFPVLFMEKIVAIPGTHIYTYLLPLSFVMGVVLSWLFYKLSRKNLLRMVYNSLLIILFTFVFYQSYKIFVDNEKEYPWENESFLFWEFRTPDISKYHLSLFGFPYYRNWQAIADYAKNYPEVKAYTSNENNAISNYYLKMEKSTDKAGFYVYIRNPQSYKNNTNNQKYLYWASKNDPVFTISRRGDALVNLYLMPPGSLQDLVTAGY